MGLSRKPGRFNDNGALFRGPNCDQVRANREDVFVVESNSELPWSEIHFVGYVVMKFVDFRKWLRSRRSNGMGWP